jgi:hypothetical protein
MSNARRMRVEYQAAPMHDDAIIECATLKVPACEKTSFEVERGRMSNDDFSTV